MTSLAKEYEGYSAAFKVDDSPNMRYANDTLLTPLFEQNMSYECVKCELLFVQAPVIDYKYA